MEHRACCEQSRTERNAGIDDGGQDPAARRGSFRDHHRSGALTGYRSRIAGHGFTGRTGTQGSIAEGTASRSPTLKISLSY